MRTMSAIEQTTAALPLPALNPPRRYLFGPGPTMVDPRVYEALSKPIVGHLDPYFIQVMADVQQLLKTAFGTTEGATLVISGTGSAGMEAAVTNFVEPQAKFAIFANGYFSDRLTEMAKRQGANVVRFEKSWGETFSDDEATEFIRREKPAVVAYVHAETSTGHCSRARRSVLRPMRSAPSQSPTASPPWADCLWSSIGLESTSRTVARKKD